MDARPPVPPPDDDQRIAAELQLQELRAQQFIDDDARLAAQLQEHERWQQESETHHVPPIVLERRVSPHAQETEAQDQVRLLRTRNLPAHAKIHSRSPRSVAARMA